MRYSSLGAAQRQDSLSDNRGVGHRFMIAQAHVAGRTRGGRVIYQAQMATHGTPSVANELQIARRELLSFEERGRQMEVEENQ